MDQIYEKCPKRDLKIIIGDMNAKIGQERMYRTITGKYSLHTLSNDNGIRLINSACYKIMVVVNTVFNHKDLLKMTWRSSDEKNFQSDKSPPSRCKTCI